jgi:hypothetical protein
VEPEIQDVILCYQGITWHNDQRQASRWAYWQQVLKCNFMCHMSLCWAMHLEQGIPEISASINSALRCAMPGSLGILQATTETESSKMEYTKSHLSQNWMWILWNGYTISLKKSQKLRGWWYSPCITAEVALRMPYHWIQGTSENEVPLTDTRNRPQGGATSRHKEATSRKLYHSIEGTSLKEALLMGYKEPAPRGL